ncbi:hypothetical protein X777_05817 [Ooceraea biroi]|uniref:Uncharacterized protein n=1 Tax=Ooceraea biroi TaxID=2015173 RepID=A0A026WG15_OOCBI|nr:hypothetical protein X777_05817 [Ooceraea biroi]
MVAVWLLSHVHEMRERIFVLEIGGVAARYRGHRCHVPQKLTDKQIPRDFR